MQRKKRDTEKNVTAKSKSPDELSNKHHYLTDMKSQFAIQHARSHSRSAFIEAMKKQMQHVDPEDLKIKKVAFMEHICKNCDNLVIPREGLMKGQTLCVCDDKKNPKVPHVHATQLHFHCSTNQFKLKIK